MVLVSSDAGATRDRKPRSGTVRQGGDLRVTVPKGREEPGRKVPGDVGSVLRSVLQGLRVQAPGVSAILGYIQIPASAKKTKPGASRTEPSPSGLFWIRVLALGAGLLTIIHMPRQPHLETFIN